MCKYQLSSVQSKQEPSKTIFKGNNITCKTFLFLTSAHVLQKLLRFSVLKVKAPILRAVIKDSIADAIAIADNRILVGIL